MEPNTWRKNEKQARAPIRYNFAHFFVFETFVKVRLEST